jgi:hypothetical protein
MELYLQFGYGMMEHCRHLIEEWGGGTAVLSPRDLNEAQLKRLAKTLRALPSGNILLDPQFYLPHADHARLCKHSFWPNNYSTGTFWQGPGLNELLKKLLRLNFELEASAFILPGILAAAIDADWLETQRAIWAEASTLNAGIPLFLTVALSADALKNNDQVALLMEESEKWNVPGCYLVFEHPNGDYLVEDPNWLANTLDVAAGFKLRGSKVVVGYSNHQMLITSCAKADAICSGTWMNVRSFPPDKFRASYEDEIKQRSTWVYSPKALSEYKVPSLDLAHRQGLISDLRPEGALMNPYVSPIFAGPQPSSVGFTEQAAFRHYLHCLRLQTQASVEGTFDDTLRHHEMLLDEADILLRRAAAAGVLGQQRDFRNITDVNRGALAVLKSTPAPMLRHRWSQL